MILPVPLLPLPATVLFKGWFNTSIMGQQTKVEIKIKENYEIIATFQSAGTPYTFHMKYMKKWGKTRETVASATSTFNKFLQLVLERFGNLPEFGATTTVVDEAGVVTTSTSATPEQTANVLKYAAVDVFTCVEQIVQRHRRSVLDYAIMHRERNKHTTYEEYIHLVACHCLVHSNFHAPNVDFALVDFCTTEQDFNSAVLTTRIRSTSDSDDSDDE